LAFFWTSPMILDHNIKVCSDLDNMS